MRLKHVCGVYISTAYTVSVYSLVRATRITLNSGQEREPGIKQHVQVEFEIHNWVRKAPFSASYIPALQKVSPVWTLSLHAAYNWKIIKSFHSKITFNIWGLTDIFPLTSPLCDGVVGVLLLVPGCGGTKAGTRPVTAAGGLVMPTVRCGAVGACIWYSRHFFCKTRTAAMHFVMAPL